MPSDPPPTGPAVAAEGSASPAWRRQRDAAARNEGKILDAARTLLRSRDAGSIEMREIARAAGVGVGTLYRRFGDKAGLLAAVVGGDERALQDAVLSGAPPLGPGAPPQERLDAFLRALVELTERNLNALLATDATPPGRLHVGAYGAWRLHVRALLAELRPGLAPDDVTWYADLLLAPVDPQLYALHRRDGMDPARISGRLGELARSVTREPATGGA